MARGAAAHNACTRLPPAALRTRASCWRTTSKPAPTSEGSVHSNEDREQRGQRENTWSPIHPGASRDHRAKRGDVMPWILRLIARTTLGLAVVLALVWCALALWYRLPVPEGLRGAIVLCA